MQARMNAWKSKIRQQNKRNWLSLGEELQYCVPCFSRAFYFGVVCGFSPPSSPYHLLGQDYQWQRHVAPGGVGDREHVFLIFPIFSDSEEVVVVGCSYSLCDVCTCYNSSMLIIDWPEYLKPGCLQQYFQSHFTTASDRMLYFLVRENTAAAAVELT